jgi:hypothetical protein
MFDRRWELRVGSAVSAGIGASKLVEIEMLGGYSILLFRREVVELNNLIVSRYTTTLCIDTHRRIHLHDASKRVKTA